MKIAVPIGNGTSGSVAQVFGNPPEATVGTSTGAGAGGTATGGTATGAMTGTGAGGTATGAMMGGGARMGAGLGGGDTAGAGGVATGTAGVVGSTGGGGSGKSFVPGGVSAPDPLLELDPSDVPVPLPEPLLLEVPPSVVSTVSAH